MRIRDIILDLIFPPRCPYCNDVADFGSVFCPECKAALINEKVSRVSERHLGFSACVSAVNYGDTSRKAIMRLKKIPDSYEAKFFADMLCDALASELPGMRFDAVVPVPMSESKKKKRHHNQAETLAREIAKNLKIPCLSDVLIHREGMATQHTLGREARHENANAAYCATPGAGVNGEILLVDDVMTTGATTERCGLLLRKIGATDVVVAVAATVPPIKKKSEKKPQSQEGAEKNAN